MDRRNFALGLGIAASLSVAGYSKSLTISKTSKVEVLKHFPVTRYETLCEFSTKEEAEEFVRHLYPRLASVKVARDPVKLGLIKTGYRDAVRVIYADGTIISTLFEIIDRRTGNIVIDAGFDNAPIFDCGRAWAIIENIRIDDLPVQMGKTFGSSISPYLLQPFDRGKDNVIYVDLEGNPLEI